MEYFIILYYTLLSIVLIVFLHDFYATETADKIVKQRMADDIMSITVAEIDTIFAYHSFYLPSAWFGFKHYFYPYKKEYHNDKQ